MAETKGPGARARDIALTITPAFYVLGFISWGTYAAHQELGSLPLSPIQYLLTGVVLASYILASGGVVYGITWLVHRRAPGEDLAPWERPTPVTRVLAGAMVLGTGALMMAITLWVLSGVAGTIGLLSPWTWNVHVYVWGAAGGALLVAVAVQKGGIPEAQEANSPSPRSVNAVTVAVVVTLAFPYFVLPEVEPEFGGAKERTAMVDLDPNIVAPDVLAALGGDEQPNGSALVRAGPLTVLLVTDAWLLVEASTGADSDAPRYEIPRSAIGAIQWLD